MFPSPSSEPGAETSAAGAPATEDPGGDPLLRSAFAAADLPALRDAVSRAAHAAGLRGDRLADFVLAAHELVANSVMHGGGTGTLRLWASDRQLVCEVTDRGVLADLEAGQRRPSLTGNGGAGLWIVRQACDSVQIRSAPGEGTTVRMGMVLDPRPVGGRVSP